MVAAKRPANGQRDTRRALAPGASTIARNVVSRVRKLGQSTIDGAFDGGAEAAVWEALRRGFGEASADDEAYARAFDDPNGEGMVQATIADFEKVQEHARLLLDLARWADCAKGGGAHIDGYGEIVVGPAPGYALLLARLIASLQEVVDYKLPRPSRGRRTDRWRQPWRKLVVALTQAGLKASELARLVESAPTDWLEAPYTGERLVQLGYHGPECKLEQSAARRQLVRQIDTDARRQKNADADPGRSRPKRKRSQ